MVHGRLVVVDPDFAAPPLVRAEQSVLNLEIMLCLWEIMLGNNSAFY